MVSTKTVTTYMSRSLGALVITVSAMAVTTAQTSDDQAVQDYATLLQQISDLEVSIAHKEVYVGTQQARISALEGQIESVPGVIESIAPMLEKMKVAISNEIDADLPFNVAERFNRMAAFEEILEAEDARPGEKMRRAFGIYDAEVSYGQSIQAYAGDHPVQEKSGSRLAACEQDAASTACGLSKDQTEKVQAGASISDIAVELQDGHYLRYGRLSLAYMQADGTDVLRYDPASTSWVEMSGGKAVDIRRAMKMARGESAPTVVQAPIYLAN